MTDDIPEQTAVGRLEKKLRELTARLLRWQYFGTRKAIELRETRISLGHLLAREAELVGAAAAKSREAALAPKTAFDSSAWLGELEAALRNLVAATPPTEYAEENPARYAAMVLLNRLDAERRHSPNDEAERPAEKTL